MKVIRSSDAEAKVYAGDQVKGTVGRVLVGQADGAANFCMRIFELTAGGFTPKHSHAWEHEVFIHKGTRIVFVCVIPSGVPEL